MPHVYKAIFRPRHRESMYSVKIQTELFFGFENQVGPDWDPALKKEIGKKTSIDESVHVLVKVEYQGFKMEDDSKSCIGHLLTGIQPEGQVEKEMPVLYIPRPEDDDRELEEAPKKIKSPRLVLAIEDPSLFTHVSSLLKDTPYQVVNKAHNAVALLHLLHEWNPEDVLVAHFFSPAMAGYDTLSYLTMHFDLIKIVSIGTPLSRPEMKRFHLKGVLGPNFRQEEFFEALYKVSMGKSYFEEKKKEELLAEG